LSGVPITLKALDGTILAIGTTDNTGVFQVAIADGTYNFVYGGSNATFVDGGGLWIIIANQTKTVTVDSTTLNIDLYAVSVTFHVYSFGGGGWTFSFDHIDMDTSTPGYQSTITVTPGQTLTIETAFWELETINVPVWYASVFGSWNPTQSLADLASGVASSSSHQLFKNSFSFTAPSAPGTYYVRMIGHHDYTWPNSYYTSFHYNPSLGRDNGNELISDGVNGPFGIGTIIVAVPPPTYALTITTTTGGTTNPISGTYTCVANSTVEVTAIPNATYILDHWELDNINVGSANPYTVSMNMNHTLKATFSKVKPAVPVGGYSVSVDRYDAAKTFAPYLSVMAIVMIGFIAIKRKTTRKIK
jgi:hypothetical protein